MAVAFVDPDLPEFGGQRTDFATDQAHTMRLRTGTVGDLSTPGLYGKPPIHFGRAPTPCESPWKTTPM